MTALRGTLVVVISRDSDASTTNVHHWIELIPDPTLLCDEAGIILKANHRARTFFGVEESQYSGVPVQWIIPAKSRDRFLQDWNRRSPANRLRGPERSPLTVRKSNGQSVPTWMAIDAVKSFGRSQFILVFKNASTPGIGSALDETLLSEHLSSVRHQIRNPLSVIKVFTDVLLRNKPGNLVDKQIGYLEAIRDAVVHLSALIDEIDVPEIVTVDHSAPESDRLQPINKNRSRLSA